MKIYVSGPMSGLPNNNVSAFDAAAVRLRKKGYQVINPAELDDGEPCGVQVVHVGDTLRALTKCGAVATLKNWKKSRGANLEVHVARALAFEIHPLAYYLKRRKK